MATVNPWRRFIGLLPGGVRTVAVVQSIDTLAGTSVVQFRNGAQTTVRGTAVPVGDRAYIADAQITGPAPDLPHYDVEV